MVGKIVFINNNLVHIALEAGTPITENLMNMHIVFEEATRKILGEVEEVTREVIKVRFMGELVDGNFKGGVIRKPSLSAKIRFITTEELGSIIGQNKDSSFLLGSSPLYDNYPIMGNINDIFSSHLAFFGNSGSGKSCGVARILQNIFYDKNIFPVKSNILIIDAYGEYHTAFNRLNEVNPNYNFRYLTTDKNDTAGAKFKIPLWLLEIEDIALMLQATKHNQLMVIEKILKLAYIFAMEEQTANKYKNHLIASAIMNILYSNQTSSSKRNEIFTLIASCSTPEFSLNTEVQGVGYTRKFRECFLIDSKGNFSESVLLTEYVNKFISDDLANYEAPERRMFNLIDLERALNFALISEGLLHNDESFADAVMLKVKLHSLVVGRYKDYFDYEEYISKEKYITSLFTSGTSKTQITNINLEDVDDWFGKFITKAVSKLLFDYSKAQTKRASLPFHIFVEEAHRYVQNDSDTDLFGYNIFERISKEGRKYGILLNLISQRPVELSETVISQFANFFIFKLNHPRDLEYVKQMLPNINSEIVEKQKTLQPGTCVGFGTAFKIPLIIKMDMPNPAPSSSSCDIYNSWRIKDN